MKKVNFDNLTNIEVPDSLIKSALNVPNKTPKHPLLPVRFHRFAAGIAACVVIAAAVTLSLMFGFHNDVDLTNPDPETPMRSDLISNKNSPTSTPDVSEPSKSPPPHSGEAAQSDSAATEPKKSSGSGSSSPQGMAQTKRESAAQTSDSKKSDSTKQKPESSKPQPVTNQPVTQEPEENDPPQTEPEEQPTTENYSDEAIGSTVELWFTTSVDKRFIEGDTFCRLVDENGNVLGSGDLFDTSRRAYKGVEYNNRVRLFLTESAHLGLVPDKTYIVIFYDEHGRTLKRGSVLINPNETIVYYI